MPKKSKQQILEDKSRHRFHAAVPEEWTVRDIPKDFGIDIEVEIFDRMAEGPDRVVETRGLMMKVQLKATATITRSLPAVDVKVDHVRYWNGLDTPVLVVLYVEDQDEFYCKWAVSHDPGAKGWPKKYTTVSFTPEDRLRIRIGELQSEIVLLRAMRSESMPAPIPLRLASDLDAGAVYRLERALRDVVAGFGLNDTLRVTLDKQQPAMELRINGNYVKSSLPLNSRSITLPRAAIDYDARNDPDSAVANSLILLAAHLSMLGSTTECVRLVEALWPLAGACVVPDLARAIGLALMREGRSDLGLAIVEHAVGLGVIDESLLVETYLLPGIVRAYQLSDAEFGVMQKAMEDLVDQALVDDRAEVAGLLEFNLACAVGRRKQASEALPLFELALAHRPQYEEFVPYWGALGSNAFRADRPDLSADAYKRALDLDPDVENGRRDLADALMFAGRYRAALDVITGSADGAAPLTDMLSVVNGAALAEVIGVLEVDEQVRVPILENEIDDGQEPNAELAMRLLKEADGLSPGLWLMLDRDHLRWSLNRATLLARLWLKWPVFWADAAIKAYTETTRCAEMFEPIVQMGFNDTGDAFIDALEGMLATHQVDDKAVIMGEAFRIAGLPGHRRRPFTVLSSDRPDEPVLFELPNYGEDWSR